MGNESSAGQVGHNQDMRRGLRLMLVLTAVLGLAGCQPTEEASEGPSLPPPPDVAAPPADARRSPSGLAWKVLEPGKGTRHPRPNSHVTVHYTGWTADGKMFDSSITRGEPAEFALSDVIRGWTEGLQMMVEGEKRRFWIPPDLAYGNSAKPNAPQGMLVFDVELLRIGS